VPSEGPGLSPLKSVYAEFQGKRYPLGSGIQVKPMKPPRDRYGHQAEKYGIRFVAMDEGGKVTCKHFRSK